MALVFNNNFLLYNLRLIIINVKKMVLYFTVFTDLHGYTVYLINDIRSSLTADAVTITEYKIRNINNYLCLLIYDFFFFNI